MALGWLTVGPGLSCLHAKQFSDIRIFKAEIAIFQIMLHMRRSVWKTRRCTMSKILKSPSRYVQGQGILAEFDQYLQGFGKRLLILISQSGVKRICPTLETCFEGKDYELHYEIFRGECSQSQIDRLVASAQEHGCTAVVGIGGGKILDTAKGVAHYAGLPVVIVPTVASTKAPVALLVAGMGDAMATWFEARACRASGSNNQTAGKPTRAATGLAAMCWEYLQRDGLRAKQAVEAGVCTEAVETIVEVNTYLSSVGFESGGLAAAHAIQKGFTFIPELHDLYHGNKVAFCTLTQLVMEDAAPEELDAVLGFCCDVGLPVCFRDMGYETVDHDLLHLAAEKACVPGATIHNMPFAVTPDMVYSAMVAADAAGRAYHQRRKA